MQLRGTPINNTTICTKGVMNFGSLLSGGHVFMNEQQSFKRGCTASFVNNKLYQR